jgi:molybdenum cofactor cytidylyltransferase
VTANEPRVSNDRSRVAAIVPAAGSSRRFGSGNKLLAVIAGRPLIAWAVNAFLASRASEVIVVTGPDHQEIERALTGLPVRFVSNPDHLSGMGGSIARGAAVLGPDCDAVLICPGDMPGVTAALIDRLISTFESGAGDRVLRPMLPDGRPGHPVLWPRRFFTQLARLKGQDGARPLLAENTDLVTTIPVSDGGAAADIDTAEDLEQFRQRMRATHAS